MNTPQDKTRGWPLKLPGDWRVQFGLLATIFWFLIGLTYVFILIGWEAFIRQPSEVMGSFLEGAFAPLAFLWLVIGYFMQNDALNKSNQHVEQQYEQMRRQAQHAEVQAEAMAANELYARQENFLRISDLVFTHLDSITGLLYQANQAITGWQPSRQAEVQELWSRVSAGDHGAFARRLLDICYSPVGRRPDGIRVFFGSRVRMRHTQDFKQTFEALLDGARKCDSGDMITNALMMGSAHGHLYRLIRKYETDRESASVSALPGRDQAENPAEAEAAEQTENQA